MQIGDSHAHMCTISWTVTIWATGQNPTMLFFCESKFVTVPSLSFPVLTAMVLHESNRNTSTVYPVNSKNNSKKTPATVEKTHSFLYLHQAWLTSKSWLLGISSSNDNTEAKQFSTFQRRFQSGSHRIWNFDPAHSNKMSLLQTYLEKGIAN